MGSEASKAKLWKILLIGAVFAAINIAAVAVFRSYNISPSTSEIEGGPFGRTYLVQTKNFGDADHIEAYVILQSGEASSTGPEGMLHYVEHLAWLNAVGQNRGGSGSDSNAWTDNNSVGYWLSGPKASLKTNVEILSGIFKPLALAENFALEERNIVLREYDYRVTNSPDAKASEALNKYLYQPNGLARSVIGAPSEIPAFDLQKAKKLQQATHFEENAILLVVGDVTENEVRAAWPKLPPSNKHEFAPAKFALAESQTEIFQFTESVSPRLVWRRVAQLNQAEDYNLLVLRCRLLEMILTTDLPGGLAKPLRFENFFASRFDLSLRPLDESHVELQFYASPDKNVKLKDLQTAFEKALSTSAKNIPQETFDRVLERYKKDLPADKDHMAISQWMKNNAINNLSNQREPLSLDEVRKRYAQLTKPSIAALLTSINAGGRTAIGFLGKEE
jgi:predicted Zn-dependent peptidase